MKDPNLLRLDMITGGESSSKVSKRCTKSGGVILKIRDPQMHKHMKFDHFKMNIGGLSNGLQVKKKRVIDGMKMISNSHLA